MQNYSCKNCGAKLYWDPKANCLKCQYCDEEYQVTDFEDNTDTTAPVESEEVDRTYTNASTASEDMSVYECKNCGGSVVVLGTTMATVCPYCGEAISITSKSAGEFRPAACIPFKVDKKAAVEAYKQYVNKSFLTPKEFKQDNIVEKMQGLFTPFYLHSLVNTAHHTFVGEKITHSRRGDDRVATHKVYDLNIDAVGYFDKLPTDASDRIDDAMMEAVEPFNYDDYKTYNPAYMAGFMAEQADDDKEKLNERAEKRSDDSMRRKAHAAFSAYDTLLLKGERTKISNHESEYAMLPVWMLNVKHGEQKFQFAVNGQTGKVVGKLPIDKAKLATIGAISFVAIDIIAMLIRMFM